MKKTDPQIGQLLTFNWDVKISWVFIVFIVILTIGFLFEFNQGVLVNI